MLEKNNYKEIEKEINKIVNLLEDKKDNEYKGLYKGISTLLGPLVKEPDILFLGINSGDGAYKELNGDKSTNKTPLRMIGENEIFLNETLDWFKPNTARCYRHENSSWKAPAKWYQRDMPINNIFPARMIDLLYAIAEKKYPTYIDNYAEPFWKNEFTIMNTNLYPIITKDINDLSKIFKLLLKEGSLNELWNSNKKIKKWDVQLFFIKLAHRLVDLVKPKLIVCLGTSVFDDFLCNGGKRDGDKIFTSKYNNIPVIGFSRSGNWSGLIPILADEINNIVNMNED